MGLLKWIAGRALAQFVAHVDGSPEAAERLAIMRRSSEIQLAARRWAVSPLEDQAAARALAAEIEDRGEPWRGAIDYFADPRDNFVCDRAYRLLTAVDEDAQVRPIDPAVRVLFEAEERLGRLPLKDAFAWLAEREPRLRDAERQVLDCQAGAADDASRDRVVDAAWKQMESLVGFGARGKGWLMRSDVTEAIVFRYLIAAAGHRGEDPSCAFFDRPGDISRTILLWGLNRPAAQN